MIRESVTDRIAVITDVVGQRFCARLLPPVMPARIAHRRHQPRLRVLHPRLGLHVCEKDFLHQILGIRIGHAEFATGDMQKKIAILHVENADVGRLRMRNDRRIHAREHTALR